MHTPVGSLRARLAEPAESDFADSLEVMKSFGSRSIAVCPRENTAIGVVATNARLNKEEVNKVAQMAQDGLARTVRPAHTMVDGDTLFGPICWQPQSGCGPSWAHSRPSGSPGIVRRSRWRSPRRSAGFLGTKLMSKEIVLIVEITSSARKRCGNIDLRRLRGRHRLEWVGSLEKMSITSPDLILSDIAMPYGRFTFFRTVRRPARMDGNPLCFS